MRKRDSGMLWYPLTVLQSWACDKGESQRISTFTDIQLCFVNIHSVSNSSDGYDDNGVAVKARG